MASDEGRVAGDERESPAAGAAGTPPLVSPPDPPPPEAQPWRPLLNVMSKLEGSPEEHAAWLEATWPQLEAEVEARHQAGRAATPKSILFGFYRTYLRGEREFRGAVPKRIRAQMEAWEAEHGEGNRQAAEREAATG